MTSQETALEKKLLDAARKAKKKSYSPYSHFPVGAAVMLDNGQIFSGTNIENASYGLTCCAERVAIFTARSASESSIIGLGLSLGQENAILETDSMVPCGACRQVMVEFMTGDTPIYIDGGQNFILNELLPHSFKLK